MRTSDAQTHFEQAIDIAKANNDAFAEQLALGMIDLLKSIRAELHQHRQQLDRIQRQTN